MVGGTLFGAYSQYQQGKAQQQAANYQADIEDRNAKLAMRQAEDATARGAQEELNLRRQTAKLKGSQIAAIGASGGDLSGSAIDLLTDTAHQSELDAANIRYNSQRERWGYEVQASNHRGQANAYRAAASNAKKAGTMGAVGSLLTGATSLSNSLYKKKKSTNTPQSVYSSDRDNYFY